MPKTRRNKKGGKRRKSMKGGDGEVIPDISEIAADAKASSGFPEHIDNLFAALKKKNEESKAALKGLQMEAKGTLASAQAQAKQEFTSAQAQAKQELASAQAQATQGVGSVQGRLSGLFSGGSSQRGGTLLPAEAQ